MYIYVYTNRPFRGRVYTTLFYRGILIRQDILENTSHCTTIMTLATGLIEEIKHALEEHHPGAILLEGEHDDLALVGYDHIEGRAIYSVATMINNYVEKDGMLNWEEATEHFDFNVMGTFQGMTDPGRPIFLFEP